MAPTPSRAAAPVSRRTLLGAAGLLGLAAAAGCTVSDPRIQGGAGQASGANGSASPNGSPASPTPSASPAMPGAAAAARAEEAVGTLAAAVLTSKAQLDAGQRRLVTAIRDAHRLHGAVLRSPDPTARSAAGATPGPTPAKPAKASLAALIAAEESLASRHGKLVPASRGLTALLFGSLGVAATTYASALGSKGNVPVSATPTDPPRPEVLDDVAGLQAALAQLYALVYGYQVAIGRLAVGTPARTRAVNGLIERRALRDQLITILLARKASVPAAEPAYVPSVKAVDASSAGRLIARMETAFVPFAGQWLAAAAQPADQALAWATMRRAASLARTWGGPISAWPGWPS